MGLRELKGREGQAVELTEGEFSLLRRTCRRRSAYWAGISCWTCREHNAEVYDRSIDVQILRLRRKIEVDPANPKFILTERGAGYLFNSGVEVVV